MLDVMWLASARMVCGAAVSMQAGGGGGAGGGAVGEVGGRVAGFAALDWVILGMYFVLLAGTGWWFSRREPSGAREYFLAGRSMPVWAVALSVLATSTSAATFIGGPEEGYARNLTYLSTNIGMLCAVTVVAVFFIPAFYRHNCTTVYDVLEVRMGHAAKQGASWAFMGGRVLASGARLYMAAIPLALILFREAHPGQLILAIGVLTVAGILYTLVGGIRSIIWTDCIQFAVFVGAAVAAAVMLLQRIPAPVGEIWEALAATRVGNDSKLTVVTLGLDFDRPGWGFDPGRSYTLLTAIFGFTLLGIASYGTDHDLAQRMLTCKSAWRGSSSVVVAIVMNLPVALLFTSLGLLLYVFYQRPELMGGVAPAAPESKKEVFLSFILNEMPAGMSGLMMAGLFAAGLGSFNSALNAMAAAFVNDVYQPLRPGKGERHYLVAGRWAVAGWGVVLGAFAVLCVYWQRWAEQQAAAEGRTGTTLIEFALGVMTFAYAGLLGVFFTALFTKRGTGASAIAALVTGLVVVAALQPWGMAVWAGGIAWPSEADPGRTLAQVKIAFPWVLLLGTTAATAVCMAAKGRKAEGVRTGI